MIPKWTTDVFLRDVSYYLSSISIFLVAFLPSPFLPVCWFLLLLLRMLCFLLSHSHLHFLRRGLHFNPVLNFRLPASWYFSARVNTMSPDSQVFSRWCFSNAECAQGKSSYLFSRYLDIDSSVEPHFSFNSSSAFCII